MYICTDCEKKFFNPKTVFESHGMKSPPYEKHFLCPYCESEDIAEIEVKHCKGCGARLCLDEKGDYCSNLCKKRAEKLRAIEQKRKKQRLDSPIYTAVRAMILYNKEHGTNLSYGEFTSLVKGEK